VPTRAVVAVGTLSIRTDLAESPRAATQSPSYACAGLTQDRCDGTYVRVTKDNVIVIAAAAPKKKLNVRQGHHILIPAPSS
jgi:hypothetical protein